MFLSIPSYYINSSPVEHPMHQIKNTWWNALVVVANQHKLPLCISISR